jgi:hypothetical protein
MSAIDFGYPLYVGIMISSLLNQVVMEQLCAARAGQSLGCLKSVASHCRCALLLKAGHPALSGVQKNGQFVTFWSVAAWCGRLPSA